MTISIMGSALHKESHTNTKNYTVVSVIISMSIELVRTHAKTLACSYTIYIGL